jgi:hypothetical protein
MSKYKKLLNALNLTKTENENNLINNLLKVPKKDKGLNVAHTYNPTQNGIHQIDILYLPHDTKYKYCLVAVDLATAHMDAEALKTKDSTEVCKALIKIYKRRYLNIPETIEVDSGREFKNTFAAYWKDYADIRTKEPGRHRQQAVVESMNGLLGKLLFMKMSEKELQTDKVNREWVKFLPLVVKEINHYLTHEPIVIDAMDDKNITRAEGPARNVIPIGTKVRVQLDNPIENVTNKKLIGKFRKTDFRWKQKPEEVTRVYLRPAAPPLYKVGENENVAYTFNQLQPVKDNEIAPKKIQPKTKNKK